jgi:hypothetical protein
MLFHDLYMEKIATPRYIKNLASMAALPKGTSREVASMVAQYKAGKALGSQIGQKAQMAKKYPGLAEKALPEAAIPGRLQGPKQMNRLEQGLATAKQKTKDFAGKFETNADNIKNNPEYLRVKAKAMKARRAAVAAARSPGIQAGVGGALALGAGALGARALMKRQAAKKLRRRLMIAGGAGAGALALGGGLAASRR